MTEVAGDQVGDEYRSSSCAGTCVCEQQLCSISRLAVVQSVAGLRQSLIPLIFRSDDCCHNKHLSHEPDHQLSDRSIVVSN